MTHTSLPAPVRPSPGGPRPSLAALLAPRYGLQADAIQALESSLIPHRITRGTRFACQGALWKEIMFVHSGAARSFATLESGDEITYFLFFEGSWICDLRSYHEGTPSRFDFEALEDLEVSSLSRTSLDRLLPRFPPLIQAFFDLSLHSYAELDRRMESFMLQSPSARYQAFMKAHQDQADRIPQYILASWLGVKPESLSRIKRKLRSKKADINLDQ